MSCPEQDSPATRLASSVGGRQHHIVSNNGSLLMKSKPQPEALHFGVSKYAAELGLHSACTFVVPTKLSYVEYPISQHCRQLRFNVYCRQGVVCFLSKLVHTTTNPYLTLKPLFLSCFFFFLVDFQGTSFLILGIRGMLAMALTFSCMCRTLSPIIFPLNTKWLSECALLSCVFHLKTL